MGSAEQKETTILEDEDIHTPDEHVSASVTADLHIKHLHVPFLSSPLCTHHTYTYAQNAGLAVENIASTDLVVKGGGGREEEGGGGGGGVQRKGWEKQRKKKKGKQVPAKKKTVPAKKKKKMEGKRKVCNTRTDCSAVCNLTPPPPHTHTHSLQSTEVVCEERKEVEEVGAESEGGDEGESHSNNRLRKRTTQVARTRDESDEEEESRGSEEEDEEEWKHLQKSVPKQKNKLDLASNESHPVHAPFFPEVCPVM